MCNELKVGQLRTTGKRVYEVLFVGKHMSFVSVSTDDATGEELRVSNTRAQQWEVVTKYHDFKIDDPVVVVGGTFLGNKRHFAGLSACGKPKVWCQGRTRHSARDSDDYVIVDEVRRV